MEVEVIWSEALEVEVFPIPLDWFEVLFWLDGEPVLFEDEVFPLVPVFEDDLFIELELATGLEDLVMLGPELEVFWLLVEEFPVPTLPTVDPMEVLPPEVEDLFEDWVELDIVLFPDTEAIERSERDRRKDER